MVLHSLPSNPTAYSEFKSREREEISNMKTPAKKSVENNRIISGHISTLHRRFYHALNLGPRWSSDKGKWQCTSIEIQKLVLRSADAFLDCVTKETSNHPLVKDCIADIVGALTFILHFKNESILDSASNVALKMIKVISNPILEAHILDIVHPLSCSLSSVQPRVSLACAASLKLIVNKLIGKNESNVWEILSETNAINSIITNIQDFRKGTIPDESFLAKVSLLSQILRIWSASRYTIWNNVKVMNMLESIILNGDYSVRLVIMQLYSSIALCSHGANKLLEGGEILVQTIMRSMNASDSPKLQLEAFKLAQFLAMNEERCDKMMNISGEHIIKAIVNEMDKWNMQTEKIAKAKISLLEEACRLCLIIVRHGGDRHTSFWKLGLNKILLNLLLNDSHKANEELSSVQEQIKIAKMALHLDVLSLRPYIWDIVGCLVAHYEEDLENDVNIDLLIACACSALVDSIQTSRRISQSDVSTRFANEIASRTALFMIYSPCKYIASRSRFILSELLKINGKEILKDLLSIIDAMSSPEMVQIINLIGLACYTGLLDYQKYLLTMRAKKTLLTFIKKWLNNPIHIKRVNLSNHSGKQICCYNMKKDWEGNDGILLFSLWGLAELIHNSESEENHFSSSTEIVSLLEGICSGSYAPAPRFYASYILTFFGRYGFRSELGKRIFKVFDENGPSDLKLVFANEEYISVHGVIIMVRCPSLMPLGEKTYNNSTKEVRLSNRVDHRALSKLLEFVYSGYMQVENEDLVKHLKILARHCKLKALVQMLSRKRPKWGTPLQKIDLRPAIRDPEHHFSDIILEAKAEADEQVNTACNTCSVLVPHAHVHKLILGSSCDYFRALFLSGMQESWSKVIKVPVSWEALRIVVNWIYTDELEKPQTGCLWKNMDLEEKLEQVGPYIELCWISEFWCVQDLYGECEEVIKCCLLSARKMGIKVLQIAAELSLWELVNVAATYVAPLYQTLRYSGELDEVDEELVDLIRAASVRFSQEGG